MKPIILKVLLTVTFSMCFREALGNPKKLSFEFWGCLKKNSLISKYKLNFSMPFSYFILHKRIFNFENTRNYKSDVNFNVTTAVNSWYFYVEANPSFTFCCKKFFRFFVR